MEPGSDRVDERYAHVSQRLNGASTWGAIGIHLLLALSVHDKPRSLAWVLGSLCVFLPINAWITLVLLKKRGPGTAETARLVVNVSASLLINSAIGWPITVWLWLPFVAIMFEGWKRRTNWVALTVMCVTVDALALFQHVPWIHPLVFTALAYFCRAITEMRLSIVRDMFERSEEQRGALNEAHESLRLAHDRLTTEAAARERVELELRQAHKLEAIGRLASGVAHEINTPLQFVTNSAQFVGEAVDDLLAMLERTRSGAVSKPDEGPAPSELDRAATETNFQYLKTNTPEAVRLIVDGVGRVSAIVASLKELAHPSATEKVELDLNQAIGTALTVAKHEYKYVADIKTDLGSLPPVKCHPGEIHQVLINLLINAAHAITEGGKHDQRGLIAIRSYVSSEEVVVSMSDNGCGIPVAARDKIFEPFFTTKEGGKGTGQGLAIARSIVVDKHGGRLDFEPRRNGGTTFSIRLPLSARRSDGGKQAA
jgi:signal transduction histidine kinase